MTMSPEELDYMRQYTIDFFQMMEDPSTQGQHFREYAETFGKYPNTLNRLMLMMAYEEWKRRPMHERAKLRPKDFELLPPEQQWEIDRELGILDWDGSEG